MPIADDLIAAAQQASADVPVQDVLIGLYWMAVRSRRIGLATAQVDSGSELRGAGDLHRKSAYELIEYFRSPRLMEASLGLAAINSMLPVDHLPMVEFNARDLLVEMGRGKKVALIGHFAFTETLRQSAGRLWVLELDPQPGDEPAENAEYILPQADVIGLTGSTLSNHTFEDLLPMFPPHALVVMIGPSTPLCPVMFDYRINVLAGSVVDDSEQAMRLIGQGSPLHHSRGLRRFTLVRDPATLTA